MYLRETPVFVYFEPKLAFIHIITGASQGHAEHAEHAEEIDKIPKNTPKINVFFQFVPISAKFSQNTPDFLIFLLSCDATDHGSFARKGQPWEHVPTFQWDARSRLFW